MFDRLATFLLAARWPLLLVLALATALAGWQGLSVRFDFSPRSIFLTHDTELAFVEEHRQVFGDEDALVGLMVEADDIFAPSALQVLIDLTERIGQLDHVDGVLSLASMQRIHGQGGFVEVEPLLDEVPDAAGIEALREEATGNPLYVGRLVNAEGTAATVMAHIEPGFYDEVARRPLLAALEGFAEDLGGEGLSFSLIGVPVVNREYATLLQNDMLRTVLGAVLLVGALLWVLFRSTLGVALPLASVGLAMTWTVGYMGVAGDGFNIINAIVPALLLVIAVGDAVHFLTTYYQDLGAGSQKTEAIRSMVRRVGGACLLTSVTAAVGFASLAVARIDIIKGMGRVAAVGLMLAYVVILVLVPAVLSLVKTPQAGLDTDPREGPIGWLLVWVGEVTTRSKGMVMAVTAVVLAAAVAGSWFVKTDNFLLEELFPTNTVYRAMHRSEQVLSGVMPVEVAIIADEPNGVLEPEVLRGMVELQQAIADEPFLGHSISVADLVLEISAVYFEEKRLPSSRAGVAQMLVPLTNAEDTSFLDSLVNSDRSRARISASAKDWGTKNVLGWWDGSAPCDPRSKCEKPFKQIIDETFGTVDGRKEGLTVRVTGSSLVAARALSKLVEDMLASLGTAFFVITLLMMVLLRSLRIGLMSMVPNILPLVLTLGFMGWTGIPIRTSTALIFSVALGVAVNDTIHFLTRYREEFFDCWDREEAVRRTLLSTGRAIIFTSLLLICGFLVMLTTRFAGIFQMGLLGSVALFAALLGDLLVLPVCLVVFKPWSRFVPDDKR